jgi:hypothetical protein
MIVLRTEPGGPIRWQRSICDDEGVISNWENSPFDLRRRELTLTDPVHEIVISEEVGAALRELRLLDTDCERLVFRIRVHNDCTILAGTDEDLEELIRSVAAEANHESHRRGRQRLDARIRRAQRRSRNSGRLGDPMACPGLDVARVQRRSAAGCPSTRATRFASNANPPPDT